MQQLLESIVRALSPISCVRAVVLGGSRATGTDTAASDVDIGVYYDAALLDLPALCAAAQQLDDAHRENLIGLPGSWGAWVNCGGWLTIGGMHVDLILRDLSRVAACIEQTDRGEITTHYQTGHPHAYLNVMYRGELAACRTLHAKEESFRQMKAHAAAYPDALAQAMTGFFLFEAGFSCDLAKKALPSGDAYYVSGHVFRAISALNQALFALNRTYCLNEKKAAARAGMLANAPRGYAQRVQGLFSSPASPEALAALHALIDDVRAMTAQAGG